MSTTVTITETYDLKTSVNKLGLIGIHTPSSRQIRELYPGLVKNHKFLKINSCDVVGACASVLPADPLSVGTTAGDVAPEDMFNPILYKAVSNESFDTLVNRIYGITDVATLGSVNKEEVYSSTADSTFNAYYALLSEHGKWIHAMPQRGFALKGLYPLCYRVLNTYGNMHEIDDGFQVEDTTSEPASDVYIDDMKGVNVPTKVNNVITSNVENKFLAVSFKGESVRLPRIPMHYKPEATDALTPEFYIPRTFVACIIVPPAKLHEFYYRMRVSWTITFEEVCSTNEYNYQSGLAYVGGHSYANEYASAKAELSAVEDTVDTNDVTISKIMES